MQPAQEHDIIAETVRIFGDGGDEIEAYLARPLGPGARGGVVVIHHMPGYDPPTKEITRTFAVNGYNAICPNLYWREAPGAAYDDAAAVVRAGGGVPDERLVGDVAGAARHLRMIPSSNGKVGVIGYCSGGRQAFLSALEVPLEAAVDCYGAFVAKDLPEGLSMPPRVALIGRAAEVGCPLLGLFGADDKYPAPEENEQLAAELTRHGKDFSFHTFDGAGHAFFSVNRPSYRAEAAAEGWRLIFAHFGRHLASEA